MQMQNDVFVFSTFLVYEKRKLNVQIRIIFKSESNLTISFSKTSEGRKTLKDFRKEKIAFQHF